MSPTCPLCGKSKPEDALFCEDCARKIHAEYEVDVPEKVIQKEEVPDKTYLVEKSPDETTLGKETKDEAELDNRTPNESALNEETVPETVQSDETADESTLNVGESDDPHIPKPNKTNGLKFSTPILFLFVTALLVVAFLVYNATIRKSNLDRGGWETAVKTNSVEGYLAYMEAHPNGTHFDEAQAGLRMLKAEEATSWEKMKTSGNAAELRDFLALHPESPYVPLVKTRLDSLLWIGALRTNTEESYSNYIRLTENSEIKGDYIAEAKKRYAMLFNAQTQDAAVLDSIRTTIDGFFLSLSSVDHHGMSRFLAPTLHRFFNSGAASRERITGELLVAGARTEGETLKFFPDLQSLQYEMTGNHHYKVNVPLYKTYQKGGSAEQVHGYIVHVELDPHFLIVSIYETKPYPEAP